MLTATVYFNAITKNYSKTLSATAGDPTVSRETKFFLANIGNVKTAEDLIKSDKLFTYVMKAYGLNDMIHAKGFIRKVLEGDISKPASLANTLHDPRYKALATAFNFPADGPNTTHTAAAKRGTVDQYLEQTLETKVGRQNKGTQMALYFQRMAPSITSAYTILGDKTLLSVAQTTLGLSPSMSQANIDVQAKMITSQIKIADLRNPNKLQKFIERFTATYDAKNATATATTPSSALEINAPNISSDLLINLAQLKLGGS